MKKETNWGVVVIDICIMILAVFFSVWQNDPSYLFILILIFFSGKYLKE